MFGGLAKMFPRAPLWLSTVLTIGVRRPIGGGVYMELTETEVCRIPSLRVDTVDLLSRSRISKVALQSMETVKRYINLVSIKDRSYTRKLFAPNRFFSASGNLMRVI